MRALSMMVASCMVLLAAGCRDPAPPNGVIVCGPNGTCPTNYYCALNGTCFRLGDLPDGGFTCQDYCNCMDKACNAAGLGFANGEVDCMPACMKLTDKAVFCRLTHCALARDGMAGDPAKHCPHAMGADPCNIP